MKRLPRFLTNFVVTLVLVALLAPTSGLRRAITTGGMLYMAWLVGHVALKARAAWRRRARAKRGSLFPEPDPAEGAILAHCGRPISNILVGLFLFTATLLYVLSEVVIPTASQHGREILPTEYCVLLGLAAISFPLRYAWIVRFDDQGVTLGRRSTVLWTSVACWQTLVYQDEYDMVSVRQNFRDRDWNVVLRGVTMLLLNASHMEQRRIHRFLERRFSGAGGDPWDR